MPKEELKPIDVSKYTVTENGNVIKETQQLTNAKDLLKQWLQTSKASSCDNINIVTDTEQFLKEM